MPNGDSVLSYEEVGHGRNVEWASGVGLFSIVMAIVLSVPSAFFRIQAQAVALLLAMSTMAAVARSCPSSSIQSKGDRTNREAIRTIHGGRCAFDARRMEEGFKNIQSLESIPR